MENILRVVFTWLGIGFGILSLSVLHAVSIQEHKPVGIYSKLDVLNLLFLRASIVDIRDMFETAPVRNTTDFIVIHHDAVQDVSYTPIAEIKTYHREKFGRIAYHYLIATNGTIYRMQSDEAALPHALGYNHNSIAVCLHGDFDVQVPNDKQMKNLAILVRDLQKKYPSARLIGHKDISEKSCPGRNFSFNALDSLLTNQHFLLYGTGFSNLGASK